MHILRKTCVCAMTLAIAATFTMGAVQAVPLMMTQKAGGSAQLVAEPAKEAAAKPAAAKSATAPKKAKVAAAPKAKKVAKAKTAGTKPGSCGTGKYYDKKTKACADASAKKA